MNPANYLVTKGDNVTPCLTRNPHFVLVFLLEFILHPDAGMRASNDQKLQKK